MITIYDVFDVKITLEVIENGRTRCEKNQVSYEKKHCYVAINLLLELLVPVNKNVREIIMSNDCM